MQTNINGERRLCALLFSIVCSVVSLLGADDGTVVQDLTTLHDASRVLVNPHKGWYHHYPDNHIDKYKIARDADILEFPGMDYIYVRLAWAYLEPRKTNLTGL
jgi:hypothetical protein